MNLPDDFTFSQSSLQDYVDCPRRFQLRYLEGVRWPAVETEPALAHERHMQQGADFHRLIHQHIIGIPAEILSAQVQGEPLKHWWDNYLQHGLTALPEQRYPEMALLTPLGDATLVAKYDLLTIQPGKRAVIVDWKTAQKRPKRAIMEARLQTRVYRYVLAQAGAHLNGGAAIRPETIEMVYWYAEFPQQPERFPYSAEQFQADEAELLRLLDEINTRADFPLTPDERRCRFCTYRSLCERGEQAGNMADLFFDMEPEDTDFDFDFDQIAEIEF
jgi:predicted RecB family nuclease